MFNSSASKEHFAQSTTYPDFDDISNHMNEDLHQQQLKEVKFRIGVNPGKIKRQINFKIPFSKSKTASYF